MYHIHVTDSGSGSSSGPVTAALLFAHLTLRCGQLKGRVVVSSSSGILPATGNGNGTNGSSSYHPHGSAAGGGGGGGSDGADIQELVAASTYLGGGSDDAVLSEGVRERIVPYPYGGQAFAEAEQSLSRAIGKCSSNSSTAVGYFDFIIAADLAAYDGLIDYYNCRRRATTSSGHGDGHVAMVHFACQDISRAGALVQRFIESTLPHRSLRPTNEEDEEAEEEEKDSDGPTARGVVALAEREAWMETVDGVVASFAQLLSVDVLLMIF